MQFDDICKRYNIEYKITKSSVNNKQVISIPQRHIHSNCIITINRLDANEYFNRELNDRKINLLTALSGADEKINNLIETIYKYILPDSYLIVFITEYRIYFNITDILLPKYVLCSYKPFSTNTLISFACTDLIENKYQFSLKFNNYELNDNNLIKVINLYKKHRLITEAIKGMYYTETDGESYYIKSGSFGDVYHELQIKYDSIDNLTIMLDSKVIDEKQLPSVVSLFNLYRK